MTPERYLTVAEVADRLRLCRATVYNMVGRKELPPGIHFGRAVRWRLSELEAAEQALASARRNHGGAFA